MENRECGIGRGHESAGRNLSPLLLNLIIGINRARDFLEKRWGGLENKGGNKIKSDKVKK